MSDAPTVEAAQRRRQRRWRILTPVLGVLVILAALLGIALYNDRANREGALALTDEMLHSLDDRVAQQVEVFLGSGERVLRLARDLFVTSEGELDRDDILLRFAQRLLEELDHISLFMVADPRGNYVGVRRTEDGGTSTLDIRNDPAPRRFLRSLRDAEGNLTATTEEPDNGFDPRTRPWYREALARPGEAWTEMYIFFTDRVPGVTVATAVRQPGREEPIGVLALDVSLDALSRFLAGLHIGRTGRAVIVDREGRIVAHPDTALAMEETPGGLASRRLDMIGDPVLARALDRMRLEGDVRTVEEVDGARQFILATSLRSAAAAGWRIIIVVPEEDFTGFVRLNSRRALLMSLGVVGIAGLLALFLMRQGLRADAAAAQLIADRASIAAQSAAFGELAGSTALFDPMADLPPELTERLAAVAQAARACVWRLAPDGRSLRLEDSHDAERGGHTSDAMLLRDEMPALFARLATAETIAVPDAARDRGTSDLSRAWLAPLGSRALIAAPIRHGARTLGVVWVEDPRAPEAEVLGFLLPVAKLLAVRLAGGAARLAEQAAAVKAQEPVPAPQGPEVRLAGGALDPAALASLAADVHPLAAVAVIRLAEPLALADRSGPPAERALMERLAAGLEDAARAAGIPYLRVLGEEMVAIAGLSAEEAGMPAARRIAAFALAARACCLRLFEEAGAEPAFRIGLDLGVVIGGRVGTEPGFLNLWGEAVRVAGQMAASAPEAGIQASESIYAALAGSHLFRPRGRFHMPGHGAMSSFILAAEL
jgi:class 3 adenylate cyclase